jgi:hypothetical protein
MVELLSAFAAAIHERALLFDAMLAMKKIEAGWRKRQ